MASPVRATTLLMEDSHTPHVCLNGTRERPSGTRALEKQKQTDWKVRHAETLPIHITTPRLIHVVKFAKVGSSRASEDTQKKRKIVEPLWVTP